MATTRRRLPAAVCGGALLALVSCSGHSARESEERAGWQALAIRFQQCLLSGSSASCRDEIERLEWSPISAASASRQELHGTIAPGGSTFASPGRAPEGDLCISHEDIDWNFNVSPDPEYAGLLQPANNEPDVDHPAGGVIETEWEAFYLDPAYVAMPPGASPSFKSWGPPAVDMIVGDRVASRGAGVLDRGHSPFRSEIHPPYLLLWGGRRPGELVVHARASARLSRPSNYKPLPDPPEPSEALVERFALPYAPLCLPGMAPVLNLVPEIEFFYDDPAIVVDHGCDISTAVALTDLEGADFDIALSSPAAHLVGTNDPAGSNGFFSLAVAASDGSLRLELTPVSRPRQALFGARVTASWACQ